MKVSQELVKKALYQSYRGGAGPTPEQIEANNQHLMDLLKSLNIKYLYTDISSELGTESPDRVIEIDVSSRKVLLVSYDRWGYVVWVGSEFLGDQVSDKEAINIIKQQLGI